MGGWELESVGVGIEWEIARTCLNFPALWRSLMADRDSSIGVVASG